MKPTTGDGDDGDDDRGGDMFGGALKIGQFPHHGETLYRLNNGSFGACPLDVLKAQRELQNEWLYNPDDFWETLPSRFLKVQESLAHSLFHDKIRPQDLAIVDNLTAAISILVHSIVTNIRSPNSVIVINSLTYPAVRKAVEYGIEQARLRNKDQEATSSSLSILEVNIPFPLKEANSAETIQNTYREALGTLPLEADIALACVDHISSLPCLRFPVQEIVSILREFGTREVLVDGAHGPGQCNLAEEVPQMGADYYVANMHKWGFAPTSAGFMWCSPTAPSRSDLHHPIVSHQYHPGRSEYCLPEESAMLGTRDYSAMLSIPAALSFAQKLGGLEHIQRRNAALCLQVVTMLSSAWGSSWHSLLDGGHQGVAMAMVGCPGRLGDTAEKGEEVRKALKGMEIIVQKAVAVQGDCLYLRVSCAVYNHLEEYFPLRDAILSLVQGL